MNAMTPIPSCDPIMPVVQFTETVRGAVARVRKVAQAVGPEQADDLLIAEAMLHSLDSMRNEVALFAAAIRGQLSRGQTEQAEATASELRAYLGHWDDEHLLTVRRAGA